MMSKEMLHPSPREASLQRKPGYKHTKLGWIPADWGFDLIEKFATRGSGHTPDKKRPEYYDGGIKWVSLRDNSRLDNYYIRETETQISQAGLSNSSAVMHRAGTVILSRDAGVGKSAILADDMAVSQHFIAWECGSHLDNRFLYYLLQQQKPLFERMAIGSTIKTIGLPFFKKFRIPLPPLPEQQRIATLLTTWDCAITTIQALIKQLEARKRGLMQRLLTGEVRLPGFEGEWKEHSYKSLLKEVKRPVEWDDNDLYELISVRRRSGGLFHRDSLLGKEIKTKNLRTARAGDFLISKMQVVHGASGLVTPAFDSMKISGSYLSLVAKKPEVLSIEFLNWASKLPRFYHQTYVSSYGVHIEKMTFNYDSFLKLKLALPSVEEQNAITQVLNSANQELEIYRKKLKQFKLQKRGLMQQLLTGQKRLLA